jgi:hypothetical protein
MMILMKLNYYAYGLPFTRTLSIRLVIFSKCWAYPKDYVAHAEHTVQTVAADLRRGEHIPKMQNNIGRKSKLRVLRQRRSKYGGGGGCWMPYRAVPRRAALGPALGSAQLP